MGGSKNPNNQALTNIISEIAIKISKLKENTENWTNENEACTKIDLIAVTLKSTLKVNDTLKNSAPEIAADLQKCKGATPVLRAKKIQNKVKKLQDYTGELIRVFVKHAKAVQCGTGVNGPAKALQNLTQAALDSRTAFLSSE